jgi:hypothetical protein
MIEQGTVRSFVELSRVTNRYIRANPHARKTKVEVIGTFRDEDGRPVAVEEWTEVLGFHGVTITLMTAPGVHLWPPIAAFHYRLEKIER